MQWFTLNFISVSFFQMDEFVKLFTFYTRIFPRTYPLDGKFSLII